MRRRAHHSPIYELADVEADVLALTFDDGPAEWTIPILDCLERNRVRATFFVVGDCISGHESTLKRAHASGHEIGNHGRSHRKLDELDRDDIRDELKTTNARIVAVTGELPRLFRPPYFSYDTTVLAVAAKCGFDHTVNASVFVNDGAFASAGEIVEAIVPRVRRGSIIDLHDGRPPHSPPYPSGSTRNDRVPTVEAVAIIVPALVERGFEFVTVSELLASES